MKAQLLKPEVRERIKYLSSEQFGVDEKKRPAADDVPQASFRKLNIHWSASVDSSVLYGALDAIGKFISWYLRSALLCSNINIPD